MPFTSTALSLLKTFGPGLLTGAASPLTNRAGSLIMRELGILADEGSERHQEIVDALKQIQGQLAHLEDLTAAIDRKLDQLIQQLKIADLRNEILTFTRPTIDEMKTIAGYLYLHPPHGLLGIVRQAASEGKVARDHLDRFATQAVESRELSTTWDSLLGRGLSGSLSSKGLIQLWGDLHDELLDNRGYDPKLEEQCAIFQANVSALIDHQIMGAVILLNAYQHRGDGADSDIARQIVERLTDALVEQLEQFLHQIERLVFGQHNLAAPRADHLEPSAAKKIFRRADLMAVTTLAYVTGANLEGIYGRDPRRNDSLEGLTNFPAEPVEHPLFDNRVRVVQPVLLAKDRRWKAAEWDTTSDPGIVTLRPPAQSDVAVARIFKPAPKDGSTSQQLETLDLATLEEAPPGFDGPTLRFGSWLNTERVWLNIFNQPTNPRTGRNPWKTSSTTVPKMEYQARTISSSRTHETLTVGPPVLTPPEVNTAHKTLVSPMKARSQWGPFKNHHSPAQYGDWRPTHQVFGDAFRYDGPEAELRIVLFGHFDVRMRSQVEIFKNPGSSDFLQGVIQPEVKIYFVHAAPRSALTQIYSWDKATFDFKGRSGVVKTTAKVRVSAPVNIAPAPDGPIHSSAPSPFISGSPVHRLMVTLGYSVDTQGVKGNLEFEGSIDFELENLRFEW